MPAFAPPLKPPALGFGLWVGEAVDEVDDDVADFDVVELRDAEAVEGDAPTVNVAESADGAGAENVSVVGVSQRTSPFESTPQQCHTSVVWL
jgi:hypothetical protein